MLCYNFNLVTHDFINKGEDYLNFNRKAIGAALSF